MRIAFFPLYLRHLHSFVLPFSNLLCLSPGDCSLDQLFYLIIKLDFLLALVFYSLLFSCTLASLNISTRFLLVIFALWPKGETSKSAWKVLLNSGKYIAWKLLASLFLFFALTIVCHIFVIFYALHIFLLLLLLPRLTKTHCFCDSFARFSPAVCCLLQLFNCLASVITFDMALATCGCCFCLLTVAAFCLSRLLSAISHFPSPSPPSLHSHFDLLHFLY